MAVALTVTGFSEYPHLLTADDFLALDVDPKLHVELIDGELIEIADELRNMIKPQLDKEFMVFTDLDVRLDEGRVMRPDVIIATRDAFLEERPLEASDVRLVIELMPPGSTFGDRRIKPIVYGEAGLEYWRIERREDELLLFHGDEVSTGAHEAVLR